MKTIIAISVLLFGGLWFYQQQPVSEDDIYVDRLVYLKSDSSLFTGTLKVQGKITSYTTDYCKGIPCGKWAEVDRYGGVIQKGEHLDTTIFSEETRSLIATDAFVIDHWQESELPSITYPPFLTIFILKDDDFFETDKKQYDSYIQQLANAVMNDTRSLKYDYLSISFANSVRDWNQHYSKEYKLEAGKLVETE